MKNRTVVYTLLIGFTVIIISMLLASYDDKPKPFNYVADENVTIVDDSLMFYEYTYPDGTECKVVLTTRFYNVAIDCEGKG